MRELTLSEIQRVNGGEYVIPRCPLPGQLGDISTLGGRLDYREPCGIPRRAPVSEVPIIMGELRNWFPAAG